MGTRGVGKRGASKEELWVDMRKHTKEYKYEKDPAEQDKTSKEKKAKAEKHSFYEGMEYGEQN